jgi:succinate-semialdehyde dehydrogenase/glutarate-semialdehyde dehydrogenase
MTQMCADIQRSESAMAAHIDELTRSVPRDLLIGGAWRAGSAAERIEVLDPATESVIATVAAATTNDALEAAEAAASAFNGWRRCAPRERAEVLRRAFDLLQTRRETFATLIALENGKPLADARAEVSYAAEFLRWYSEEAVRLAGSLVEAPGGSFRVMVRHEPVGVALLVTPWNLPLAMVTRKVGPALAAGCAAIVKPASATPLCALAFAALLHDAGVPDGVINVLPTNRTREIVSTLLNNDHIRKLSFTGSTDVGRTLLTQAADRIVNCSMELGGNAPLIVFDDADLDLAVEATMVAKMRHNAEACTAANRIFVHARKAKHFSDRLTSAMVALRVGPGLELGTEVGPLIDSASRAKVAELVQIAVDCGATVTTGGIAPNRSGYFYAPTVLTDVAPDSPILHHEIFGPAAPIVTFTDDDEMLRWANSTEHGLMSYIFTKDLRRALRTAEALESGMVAVNRGVISDPAAPFGGVKQSGIGREGGHEGLLDYTESKYIGLDW